MNEEDFLEHCSFLYERLNRFFNNDMSDVERIELEEEIIWSLSELTENSKGIINTESDELKTLFEKLFICSSIILSNKWKYENARNIIYKSNDNMKKMEAKQNIGVFQSKIKSEYKNLYNLISKIINRKTR